MAVVVSNIKDLKGVQKAAILMVALGDDISAEVFKCLEEEEIQDVSREIAMLKHIQPEVADQVVEEFHPVLRAVVAEREEDPRLRGGEQLDDDRAPHRLAQGVHSGDGERRRRRRC